MSKITFRAEDELVEAIESFEASKSEVMREALREYLRSHPEVDIADASGERARQTVTDPRGSIDDLVADRIDELIAERLDRHLNERPVGRQRPPQDVNVNVTLESVSDTTGRSSTTATSPEPAERQDSPVEQPSEASDIEQESGDRKTRSAGTADGSDETDRTCSQCGEALGSDHVYCPNCGEKASRRLFCDCGDELRSDWAFCPGCGRRTPAADVLDPS